MRESFFRLNDPPLHEDGIVHVHLLTNFTSFVLKVDLWHYIFLMPIKSCLFRIVLRPPNHHAFSFIYILILISLGEGRKNKFEWACSFPQIFSCDASFSRSLRRISLGDLKVLYLHLSFYLILLS